MNMLFENKLTAKQADRLIEKYYDGRTTVAEEYKLQLFLSSKNLPQKYKAEQAMFAYLKKPVQTKKLALKTWYKWVAAAAVLLVLSISTYQITTTQHTGYAIVDGVRITDKSTISKMAQASLKEVSNIRQQIDESLYAATNSNIVYEQLQVFQTIQ